MAQTPQKGLPATDDHASEPIVGELIVEDLFVEAPQNAPAKRRLRGTAEDGEITVVAASEKADRPSKRPGFLESLHSRRKDTEKRPAQEKGKKEPPSVKKQQRPSPGRRPGTASRKRVILFIVACALLGVVLLDRGSFRGNHAVVAPPVRVATRTKEISGLRAPQHHEALPIRQRTALPIGLPAVATHATVSSPSTSRVAVAPRASSTLPLGTIPTLNIDGGIRRAQAAWLPGSTVELALDQTTATLTVRMAVVPTSAASLEQMQQGAVASPEQVNGLLDAPAPTGCVQGSTYFIHGGSELERSFHCQVPSASLSRATHTVLERHPPSLAKSIVAIVRALSTAVASRYISLEAPPMPSELPSATRGLDAGAQRVQGTSLLGWPLEIKGRFEDLAGFEGFVSLLNAAPVSLTHLSIRANRFDLQLQILGAPNTGTAPLVKH